MIIQALKTSAVIMAIVLCRRSRLLSFSMSMNTYLCEAPQASNRFGLKGRKETAEAASESNTVNTGASWYCAISSFIISMVHLLIETAALFVDPNASSSCWL